MSDRKPVIIALSVGGLALAANGAAAVIAISANAPPEAAVFGVAGLTAAFIGLITTLLWAWHEETALAPKRRHDRVFTPWDEVEPPLTARPIAAAPLAVAAAVAPAPYAQPAITPAFAPALETSDAQVIYLQDWLKAHRPQHVLA